MVVVPVLSEESPTPQGFYMLNKLVEVAEMVVPESTKKDNLSRMRASLLAQKVKLLCLQCGSTLAEGRVEELPEFPKCPTCGSGLLALASKVRPDVTQILQKWKSREELTDEERAVLSRARRAADLVLSYGIQAIVAMLTWGVGPQTAANVLAKMHVQVEGEAKVHSNPSFLGLSRNLASREGTWRYWNPETFYGAERFATRTGRTHG
jgi:hypothetical protein